jgi:photosystem II stability/assembly factor-like uncharacterized protein
MIDIRCDSARRWMQTTAELHPLDARRLDRHLGTCSRCARYRREQIEMDRLIQSTVEAASNQGSVREEVRARLSQLPASEGHRRWPFWSSPGWAAGQRLRHALPRRAVWLGAPIAATLVALAVYLPQIGPKFGSGATVVAGAPWTVDRPNITYPLAIDPSRPDHLIAGAWGRAYESWNGGKSWRALAPLPHGLLVRALAIDSADPNRYFVAVLHSVFITDDAGRHWHAAVRFVPGGPDMFVIQHPRFPSTWYLGPAVLWRSGDSGRTWARTLGTRVFAPDGIQALAIAPDGTLYTGIWGGGVADSHNGGRSWVRRAAGLALNVMDVSLQGRRLWAATDRGIYLSSDLGLHWRRVGPARHFFDTSIVDAGSYQVAGGKGGIFRSDDGGKTWTVSDEGLPLYPYVYNLVSDPHHANRVYASLNTDGIFRSDDAGRTWRPTDAGLPLTGGLHARRTVLFRRHGVLWMTDASGADPGNLTVDSQVSVAATSPDGAAVAYVTGVSNRWAVGVVDAGGSAVRTVASGHGTPPGRLLWSPNSSTLGIVSGADIWVMDLRSGNSPWIAPPAEQLVGWSADGKGLVFWQREAFRVVNREPVSGRLVGRMPGTYPTRPALAPDGRHVSLVYRATVYSGLWGHLVRLPRKLAPNCSAGPWSDDSSRFLVICSGYVVIRARDGGLLVRATLPPNTFWAPGSNAELLFFQHGLRRWTPRQGDVLLVRQARSVQSHG